MICKTFHEWSDWRNDFDLFRVRHCLKCDQWEYYRNKDGEYVFEFAVDLENVRVPFKELYGKER